MNDLLAREADRAGIAQTAVDTTPSDTDTDGGIDARVNSVPDGASNWLLAGNTGLQFKSGSCPSATELDETEFSKPEVQNII